MTRADEILANGFNEKKKGIFLIYKNKEGTVSYSLHTAVDGSSSAFEEVEAAKKNIAANFATIVTVGVGATSEHPKRKDPDVSLHGLTKNPAKGALISGGYIQVDLVVSRSGFLTFNDPKNIDKFINAAASHAAKLKYKVNRGE